MSKTTDLYIARAAKARREVEEMRRRNTAIVHERLLGGRLDYLARNSASHRDRSFAAIAANGGKLA